MEKIIIGVTDCSKYDAYASWIAKEAGVETRKIAYDGNHKETLAECRGFVLTGGEDVHPRFYNKPELLADCYPDDINEKRDEVEFNVLEFSQKNKLPLLGICRGLQVANVFFGGTLIADIPKYRNTNHSKVNGQDQYHTVNVNPKSKFFEITEQKTGEVNSAHHQSADQIAPALVSNATSQEGIIEGLEWSEPGGKPFLLLVQWHPERMKDQDSPFTKNVRSAFLDSVRINARQGIK